MTGGEIDLGGSTADKLTLGNFANTLSVANIETVLGDAGNDVIYTSDVQTCSSISLAARIR